MSSANEEYVLVGAYTRYSSWTARVETVLDHFKIPYTKKMVNLSEVKSVSPTGFVPVLEVPSLSASLLINDSLSICEFLADSHPSEPLWPKDRLLRALARSAVAEMHSGFSELRNTYDTNFVGKYTGAIPISQKARKEIERMLELWGQARKRTVDRLGQLGEVDQGYLFGEFGIVDAFFWPVLWRFRTYNLPLDTATPEALAWMRTMWKDPVLKAEAHDYFQQAERPDTKVEKYDNIFKGNPDIVYGVFTEDWEFPA